MNKFYAIRGATTIASNTSREIEKASIELIREITAQNLLGKSDLVSLICSITSDITSENPVKCMRQSNILGDTPVFCVQEANIDNSLRLCIRVMLHVQTSSQNFAPQHIYLHDAKNLRPDLTR